MKSSSTKRSVADGKRYTRRSFATPRVVISECIELEACRYDGQRITDGFVRELMDYVELVPTCPEVAIGLGVPRDTIRLVDEGGKTRLLQPSTGEDLTARMEVFAEAFLEGLGAVDGFILKSGSPSCGSRNVKVYGGVEKAPSVRREPGMFARHVQERYPDLAVEDEGRLRNHPIRHHFLTQLFSLADLRRLGEEATAAGVMDFHRRYKHLLLLYDEPGMRSLGRIAANHEKAPIGEVYEAYAEVFRRAIGEPPSRKAHLNALTHMYGHFRDELSDEERHEFLGMLDELRSRHLTLNAPIAVIRSWCARFSYEYLADQTYLEPYPRELVSMRDSGKGLDF